MVAQFIAKTTNSEKAINFLPNVSCSINKNTYSHVKILFSDLTWKIFFAPGNDSKKCSESHFTFYLKC